jgi:hypothetical protein
MWNEDPALRPKMPAIVSDMELIYSNICCVSSINWEADGLPSLAPLLEYYDLLHGLGADGDIIDDGYTRTSIWSMTPTATKPVFPLLSTSNSFREQNGDEALRGSFRGSLAGVFSNMLPGNSRQSLTGRPSGFKSSSHHNSELLGAPSTFNLVNLRDQVPREVADIIKGLKVSSHYYATV